MCAGNIEIDVLIIDELIAQQKIHLLSNQVILFVTVIVNKTANAWDVIHGKLKVSKQRICEDINLVCNVGITLYHI